MHRNSLTRSMFYRIFLEGYVAPFAKTCYVLLLLAITTQGWESIQFILQSLAPVFLRFS